MQLRPYLRYRKSRVNAHGIHSPFVFDFYNEVILKSKTVDDRPVETLRQSMLRNHEEISVTDFGAGSKKAQGDKRSVSSIAKNAAVNRKFAKLLGRIIQHYQLEYVVELGTSLGVGTASFASQPSVKKIITIEGAAEIAKIAGANFAALKLENITQLTGKFEDHLETAVKELPRIDLVYIDGNHQYQPTLDYFHFFIEHAHDAAFLVFDDIYWSEGMEKAWAAICASPKVHVSIDLFRMGIVCKRPTQEKQHFVLKF